MRHYRLTAPWVAHRIVKAMRRGESLAVTVADAALLSDLEATSVMHRYELVRLGRIGNQYVALPPEADASTDEADPGPPG